MAAKPAILGGDPAFERALPIIRPSTEEVATPELAAKITKILHSGMLSNVGNHVRALEEAFEEKLRVDHVVAVSSCTSGLVLTLQALGIRQGVVALPSYTFSATALAPLWNQNQLRYVDVDETLTVNPNLLNEMGAPLDAVMPVHIYGNPCDVQALAEWADERQVPLIYDAAHALGSLWRDQPVGSFGMAEVFSLSPTKLLTTGEGGLVATGDEDLAENLRLLRNYGNKPDYRCDLPGLNARMSELNAVLGLEMLRHLDRYVEARNRYVDRYRRLLCEVPGISFQRIRDASVSAHKDFAILVDPKDFGMDRDLLARALDVEGIRTKRYYYPPLHEVEAFRDVRVSLPVTQTVTRRVLALPIHNVMRMGDIDTVSDRIALVQTHAAEIVDKLASQGQDRRAEKGHTNTGGTSPV